MVRIRILMVVVCVAATAAMAQRSIPLSLESIVASSGMIVHGTVTKTETGKDPLTGLAATWVTVNVIENLYGAAGKSLRFKHYGGTAGGYSLRMADMPRYGTGEEMVLLLYPPSKKTGFQSPVGMAQGAFRVVSAPATSAKHVEQLGRTTALSKSASLKNISQGPNGSLDLEQFKNVLRSLIRQRASGNLR